MILPVVPFDAARAVLAEFAPSVTWDQRVGCGFRSTDGFVYFASNGEILKVGISAHPERRVRQLNDGFCVPGVYPKPPVHTVLVIDRCRYQHERAIQRALRSSKIGHRIEYKEWFHVTPEVCRLVGMLLIRADVHELPSYLRRGRNDPDWERRPRRGYLPTHPDYLRPYESEAAE